MIAVADAGPLHYLVLIDLVDLLPRYFDRLLIPSAVLWELTAPAAPSAVRSWLESAPAWLQVRNSAPVHVARIAVSLDAGEREAIALAQEVGAGMLIIDDSAGRREARRQGLSTTGTLGVLHSAAVRGDVDIRTALDRLGSTNFYVNEGTLNAIFGAWIGPSAAPGKE